jgi:ubiquinone/menaquinone biosynthesis C-methylase UbiE
MTHSNIDTYNSSSVINWYDNLGDLTCVEKHILERNQSLIKNAKLLDIGIGGGRTTNYLYSRCLSYTGIDYSQGFVNLTKNKFPALDIRCLDARNLSVFSDNSFDFINFSFNGIDYVNLIDRETIISEIYRVLKPNGIFFFSTHNMNHESFNTRAWQNPHTNFFINLKTFLKLAPFEFIHQLQKRKELYTSDFAIINDSAHNYKLLTFYTTPSFLLKQLSNIKFNKIQFFSKSGMQSKEDQLDDWIFCTCEKSIF